MINLAPHLTRLGLPLLLPSTLEVFWNEAVEIGSKGYAAQMEYMEGQIQRIGREDPLYEKLIREMLRHHEGEDWDLSVSELTSVYMLLERSGELPKIKEESLEERLRIDIGKTHMINVMNAGKNIPIVEKDNPLLYQVINGAISGRETVELRAHVMADHSTSYMLLLESL